MLQINQWKVIADEASVLLWDDAIIGWELLALDIWRSICCLVEQVLWLWQESRGLLQLLLCLGLGISLALASCAPESILN